MIIAILAGGLATRLKSLTHATPKSMLPVAGEPFIGHQLKLLAGAGIGRVHLCLGHLSDQILEYVGDGRRFGVEISFTKEGSRLLGTAGALALARPYLGDFFGVMYGDSYLPVPFLRLASEARRMGTPGVMTVWRNENRFDRSNLVVADGRVMTYSADREDPVRYDWIDYGLSFLHGDLLAGIPTDRPSALSVLWSSLVRGQQLGALPVKDRFYEIGSLKGYEELCSMAAEGGLPRSHE